MRLLILFSCSLFPSHCSPLIVRLSSFPSHCSPLIVPLSSFPCHCSPLIVRRPFSLLILSHSSIYDYCWFSLILSLCTSVHFVHFLVLFEIFPLPLLVFIVHSPPFFCSSLFIVSISLFATPLSLFIVALCLVFKSTSIPVCWSPFQPARPEIPVQGCLTLTATLRATLSGTFLQTLPDLVTPLKGYSLSPRSCPVTRSAPCERFGY